MPLACAFVIRPIAAVAITFLTLYVFVYYRKFFIAYMTGALLIGLAWIMYNLPIYHYILPPYYLSGRVDDMYTIGAALFGNLFSPARGVFVFSPVLLVAAFGVASSFRRDRNRAGNNGDVLKVSAKTGHFEIIYSFQGGSDGSSPVSGVVYQNGTLYGTTDFGGNGCSGGCGTIFSIDLGTNAEKVLYNFSQDPGPDGLAYLAGTLYGTTTFGGSNGAGSVFSFNLSTNTFATLCDFGGAGGVNPNPELLYENGRLYGTTVYGGTGQCNLGGCGTLFSVDPTTGAETLLRSFGKKDGKYPYSNLAYRGGKLFGDTNLGGDQACKRGCGVSYKINATTGKETVLDDFESKEEVFSGITIVGSSAYETLSSASGGNGALVQLDLKTGQRTTLYTFTGGDDGSNPVEQLIYHEGVFYGSTFYGGNIKCFEGCGTIFKFKL